MQDAKKLNLVTFIVFAIPGTPKDLLSYAVGLTRMKLPAWIFIAGAGRLPSIITSTIGGDALSAGNYSATAWVLAITLIVSAAGLLIYKKIYGKNGEKSCGCK
mgnify:CR=1 FL=1